MIWPCRSIEGEKPLPPLHDGMYIITHKQKNKAFKRHTPIKKAHMASPTCRNALSNFHPMHSGKPNHASFRVQPCKFQGPTMQVTKSNHASCRAQPCKFRSPTMQVTKSNHASLRRHKGFHRMPSGLSAMRMARHLQRSSLRCVEALGQKRSGASMDALKRSAARLESPSAIKAVPRASSIIPRRSRRKF